MPWSKYRPLKQFGKQNVRIFKNILKARNLRNLATARLRPEVDAYFKERAIEIHDPLDPNFFHQFERESEEPMPPKSSHPLKQVSAHPLYKTNKCLLYDGTVPLTDGIDHACALIKATKAKPFPAGFFDAFADLIPADFQTSVVDAIMHGERYDATLEKLPKRFDPIIFWVPYPAVHGTPVTKRCNIIISDLWRKIVMLSLKKDKALCSDLRTDCNAPISCFLPGSHSGLDSSFVLRQQPYLTIQGLNPLTPLADSKDIQETREMEVPDIYPISAHIDLTYENVYNDTSLVPRQFESTLNIHTICASRMRDQKYPWTTEQNAANCILNGFGAGVAQLTRNGFKDLLTCESLNQPLLVKSLQIVNGKIDFVMVQINTLDLTNKDQKVKNLVWVEKAVPLYLPKPYYENMDNVDRFNFETVKKFVAFMLYR